MAGAVFIVVDQNEARPQTHAAAVLPEQALGALVRQREAEARPLLKGTAEAFLRGHGLSQRQARAVIRAGNGTRWTLVRLPGGQARARRRRSTRQTDGVEIPTASRSGAVCHPSSPHQPIRAPLLR